MRTCVIIKSFGKWVNCPLGSCTMCDRGTGQARSYLNADGTNTPSGACATDSGVVSGSSSLTVGVSKDTSSAGTVVESSGVAGDADDCGDAGD